jgi:imidazolonepropionase-like amidohydrolase
MHSMNPLRGLLLLLALTGCASSSRVLDEAAGQERSFAIRNVRIFDGERVISARAVLVRGERIAAVGEEVDLSGVAEVIDGEAQMLLPGLIDAHFHPDGPDAYRASLAFGVTTVIDLWGEYSSVILKTGLRAVSSRENDEADALVSLLITVPGGHGTEYGEFPFKPVTTSQECRAEIRSQLEAGASIVKLVYDAGEAWSKQPVPTLSREVLADCIQEAHARGVLAIVHAWTLRESREAIEAGADGLAHGVIDTPPDTAYAQLLAARGVFMIPTLAVGSAVNRHNDEEILADPRLAPYLSPNSLKTLKSTFPDEFGQRMKPDVLKESLRLLKAAHVPILAGSDAANPQIAAGASLHHELELLVAAGLTPTEALAAATSLPAARFRLSDRGRIAPGQRADLLLVRGDPTADIRMTRDIVAVWKRGKQLDRDAYRARVEAARREGAKP